MIVVAQALHWFNEERFFREAERVLRPNGILAVFGYAFFETTPVIDDIIRKHLLAPIDHLWTKENRLLMSGYSDVKLPFTEIPETPAFSIHINWNLPQLLAYLKAWSAVKRFIAESGYDPVAELQSKIKPFWKESEKAIPVRMPLFFKASRKLST